MRPSARLAAPLVGPLAVALTSAAFGARYAPRDHVEAWLALLTLSFAGLAISARALGPILDRTSQRTLLLGAGLLGAACLVAPVSLSDDVERYAWDGHALLSGHDPYASRPEELVGAAPALDDAALARLNSPAYYTVYPPLAQVVFAVGAAIESATHLASTRAIRALFLLGLLASVAIWLRIAARIGVPPPWAAALAWNPLLAWELVAGGHTEALMLPLALLALEATLDDRPARAALFLGLAASMKLTALVWLPALALWSHRRIGLRSAPLGLAPLVTAATFLPFASPTLAPHVIESLRLFAGAFSFNAPIYYAARDALGYVEGLSPPVDAQIAPALTLASVLAWAVSAILARRGREPRALLSALAGGGVAMLLLGRVFHPWYVLPALACGLLVESRALLWLSFALPLSYLRYRAGAREEPWVLALEFVPFAALAAAQSARSSIWNLRSTDWQRRIPPKNA
ncbi:MAG: glycosyltransferase 87 family protein [Sandaracinaceae bacterium]